MFLGILIITENFDFLLKVFLVAEIGSNWEGNLTKAKKIISECSKSGADAVKFQMWRANDLYENHPQYSIIKKSELTFKKAEKIKQFSDDLGIEFFCSPFYPQAVDFLKSISVNHYKIASRTCTLKDPFSTETLYAVAQTKKPVIISMGMGGERKFIKKIFSKNKTTFCYCISEYPLAFKKINWKELLSYDGFSDHTLSLTAPILYAGFKKKLNSKEILIEKHVKLHNSQGPDASSSITTEEFKEMISQIRNIEKIKFT